MTSWEPRRMRSPEQVRKGPTMHFLFSRCGLDLPDFNHLFEPRVHGFGKALLYRDPAVRAMTELIQQYWQQYLFGTLGHPTGLVVTLWLTAASVGLGFV